MATTNSTWPPPPLPASSVLLGNGNGTFQDPVPFEPPIGAEDYPPLGTMPVNAGPSSLVTGDFNGDGRSDLAAANFGSYDIVRAAGRART